MDMYLSHRDLTLYYMIWSPDKNKTIAWLISERESAFSTNMKGENTLEVKIGIIINKSYYLPAI